MNKNGTHVYSAYGFAATAQPAQNLLGFNGEYVQEFTSLYMLGAGYRSYSPSLYRFHTPDDLSPFGIGGLNAYAYCNGDPVNRVDPTGHSGLFTRLLKGIGNRFGLRPSKKLPSDTTLSPTPISTTAFPPPGPSEYSSVNSRSSTGSMSTGYASLRSYKSVSAVPPLPQRPPPSSAGRSFFLTEDSNTIPAGQETSRIQDWVDNYSNYADPELLQSSIILRAGGGFHQRHIDVQNAGIRRSNEYIEATKSPRTLTVHRDGSEYYWKDRRR